MQIYIYGFITIRVMPKNCKSAIMWGVILWVLIFAVFSVIMFAPQLAGKTSMQRALELIIAMPVLVSFTAYMALKGTNPTAKDGIMVGICFVVISTILDLIITVPLFVKSYATFYSDWALYAGMLETIIFGGIMGYYLGNTKG